MANKEQLAILRNGVKFWNKWRAEHPKVKIDLSSAKLDKRKLSYINLSGANLVEADLSSTDLIEADFSGADLSIAWCISTNFLAADFTKADLFGAQLMAADFSLVFLQDTNLEDANLWYAKFATAYLEGAEFKGSYFGETVLSNVDLSKARGLAKARHRSPSTIGIDTIRSSQGKIPKTFLRGCGLSDWEIEFAKVYDPKLSDQEMDKILRRMSDLKAAQEQQVSPLFVSYSHADGFFVDKLGRGLAERGIRYWRDIHDLKSGRIEKQIEQAMRHNSTVLLIISKNSLKSDWVEHEVRTARLLEKELGHDVLCPVRLDDSWKSSRWPKRLMEQIMEYNILDFSEWRDDVKFESMFRKLIDGLQLFYKG
jgi:hypothetical protein